MSLETLAPPITTADTLIDHIAMRLDGLPADMPDYTRSLHLRLNDEYNVWFLDDTRRPLTLLDGTVTEYGSFKWRGAWMKLQALLAEDPELRDVHAPTAGNAGLGVAGVVLEHNRKHPDRKPITAHIYAPEYMSPVKSEKIQRTGAVIHNTFELLPSCVVAAQLAARGDHSGLILPFNDPDVIAGQGTGALSIAKLINQQDTLNDWGIYAPLGGGSYSGGGSAVTHLLKTKGALPENVFYHTVALEDKANQLWSGGTATEEGDKPLLLLNDERLVASRDVIPTHLGKQAVLGACEITNRMYEGAGALALGGMYQAIREGRAEPNMVVALTGTGITEKEYRNIARSVLGYPSLELSIEMMAAPRRELSSHRAPV